MRPLGALEVLVRVVETGSFSAVARERELSQAAVARQVSQLEEHFGVRLFHRTTRKLSLTDDGQMLLGLARPVLDGVDGMEAALGRQSASPVGLVRVGVTVAASRFLAQRLPTLLADHPGLKVERGGRSARRHDRGPARPCHARGRDHGCVTGGAPYGTAVCCRCSAKLHQAARQPSTPADLANHTCIVHDVGPNSNIWTFVTSEGSEHFRVSGGFLANDVRAVHLAARTGYGIAYLALFEVADDLRNGRLVRVLRHFPAPGVPFSLVYPSRRHLAPRTRLVIDFIWEQVRQVEAELATASDEARTA